MDAFFASVEQLDNPKLRGHPVIVGGAPEKRGVVAACSYEARSFGVHSAMPSSRALRKCPQAIFVRPRMARYQQISSTIMNIFFQFTELVEPLSLDEAFLDVTYNKKNIPSATWIAEIIRKQIVRETGLTGSAGVSCNKFLAKVASDMRKPDGLTVITPAESLPFIGSLGIGKFFGVGRVTEKKMHAFGVRTGADLRRYSRSELYNYFGKPGIFFYDIVRGIDNRPVNPNRERKSIGAETTLQRDIIAKDEIMAVLKKLAARVESSLDNKKTGGYTITLKVRYQDFITVTRSRTIRNPIFSTAEILAIVPALLNTTEAGRKRVRLLGITVSNLTKGKNAAVLRYRQLPLPFKGKFVGSVSG